MSYIVSRSGITMEAFFSSFTAVAIAEIGDKTQLLSLFLAARFQARGAIIAGICIATLLNHALSAWFGVWVTQYIPAPWQPILLGTSFIVVALWLLVPDKDDSHNSGLLRLGAFSASCILFFLAEIGDKTQIATVLLSASYSASLWLVIIGTTLGMLAANVPVVYGGQWLMQRMPLTLARVGASAVFMLLGILSLLAEPGIFHG